MSLPINILGGSTSKSVDLSTKKGVNGLIVHTLPEREYSWDIKFVENETYGSDLNQAVAAAAGTSEHIHNGNDTTYWTPTTAQGNWDYINSTTPAAGTGCVLLTNLSTNDRADFAYSGTTFVMSDFDSISGQVRFESSFTNHDLSLQMALSGTLDGNSVDIADYVDPSVTASYQAFIIPKADLGLASEELDEMRLVATKGGGPKPDVRLDNLALISAGGSEGSIVYKTEPDAGTEFLIDKIHFNFADNYTGGASYDQWGALPTLPIGVVMQVFTDGENSPTRSFNFKQLGDLLDWGYLITSNVDDGANTHLQVCLQLDTPIILDGPSGNKLTITVNDDMSGLLLFKVSIVGRTRAV